VEEFLSTIRRESNDEEVYEKLVDVISALQRGADLEKAAREVSLDRHIAIRLLDTIKECVATVVSSVPAIGAPGKTSGIGRLTALSDGASRGNPGESACAVVLFDEHNEELLRRSKRLGVTTNNVAEYEGVLLALELGAALRARELRINLDSELVVKQLNGEYKVKNPQLRVLHAKARDLARSFEKVEFARVPRQESKLADKLANDELDGKT
jgi:ribonuclease HI